MGDNAWVTLATNDSYGLGALVLGHSLRQVGTRYQLAVLITPGVTEPMREQLRSIFSVVTEVNVLDSRDEANLALLSRPELGVTFTKLHCWRLIQFSKCVFLDADTLILQNCDELFEREEFSAAPDAGWPDCFNSGVFVYKPSLDTFRSLIEFAVAKGSFDGGDQGLLNLFFKDWATQDISRHLPFIYNMCSTATYSYLPAYKQFGTQVKIIHFIGPNKPWLLYFDTVTRQVRPPAGSEHLQPLLQLWWDIFCNRVHPSLTNDMTGLAGAFAKLTLGVPRTAEQAALEEHMRKQAWEQGNIDYLGADSFDNIWKKICQTLASGPNENKVRQKSPSPVSTTETPESAKLLESLPESSQPLESELAAESEDTLLKAQKVVSTSAPFGVGSVSSTLDHTDIALADLHKLSQSSNVESSVPSDLKTVLPESNVTHTSFVLVPQSTLEDSAKFTSSQEAPNATFSSESKCEDSSLEFRASSLAEQSKSSTRQETNLGDTASAPVSENICQSDVSGHEKLIEPPMQAPSISFSQTQEVPILSDPLQVGVQSVSVGATVPTTTAEILAASETTKHTIPILPASAPTTPFQSVLVKETPTPPATVKTSAVASSVPASPVQTHLPSTPVQATFPPPTSLHTSESSTNIVTPIPSPPVQGSPDATVLIQEARVPLTSVQAVSPSTPGQTVPVPSAKASPAPIAPLHKASKKQPSDIQKVPSSTVSDISSETEAVTQKEVKSIPSFPEQRREKSSDTAQGASAPVSPSTQDSTKHPLSEQAPIPPKRKGGSKGAGGDSKASSKQGKPASKGKK